MKRTSRKPASLSESLQRHLNAYALAASEAGVGVLALAQPRADAKVIYTPAQRHFRVNHVLHLDLNHDRITDFNLELRSSVWSSWGLSWTNLTAWGANSNRLDGYRFGTTSSGAPNYILSAFPAGVKVYSGYFVRNGWMAGRYTPIGESKWKCDGPFNRAKKRYLGLQFKIKGQFHYGWARFSESCDTQGIEAVLTGYAYETIPGKAIITGHTKGPDVITLEPGSLGRLAQGSAGRLGK